MQQAPAFSRVSLQRQHQPVAVDDAGAGRKQGSDAFQRGFHDLRLGSIQPLQVRDTIAERTVVNASEAFALLICSSHQQLAAPPVLHATLLGIRIKLLTACNAQARLERAGGVVKARMDDFAVAGTGTCADGILQLPAPSLRALASKFSRDSQTHYTRPDHHTFHLIHRSSPFLGSAVCGCGLTDPASKP
jgi:hypothetical protein